MSALSSPAAPLSDADLQSVYDNAIHTALRQHHSLTGAEQHSIGLRALAALRGDGVREAARRVVNSTYVIKRDWDQMDSMGVSPDAVKALQDALVRAPSSDFVAQRKRTRFDMRWALEYIEQHHRHVYSQASEALAWCSDCKNIAAMRNELDHPRVSEGATKEEKL